MVTVSLEELNAAALLKQTLEEDSETNIKACKQYLDKKEIHV